MHPEHGHRKLGTVIRSRLDDPATFARRLRWWGTLHACGVAERIGIRRVVGFPFGSVLSAFGASTVDVRHEYSANDLEALRRQAKIDMRGEGLPAEQVEYLTPTPTATATAEPP